MIFLFLNGPKLQNEEVDNTDSKIKVKYYRLQDFIEKLAKNNRRILKFIAGNEQALRQEKVLKIKEIGTSLNSLRDLVNRNAFSKYEITEQEARKKYKVIRKEMRELARSNSIDVLIGADFNGLLDF